MTTVRREVAFAYLAALVGVLFLPVIIGGESFFGRDITPFFYPMKKLVAEVLLRLDLPLWNPWVAGGEPFFATLQPAVLYPGSLPLLVLPFPHGADWIIILHFLFGAAGWFVLLRRLGHGDPAALLGAVAFTLGGFFVSLGNFMNNLQTAAWAPWLFLAWNGFLAAPGGRRLVVFSAACVAAFLGGEPQLLALALGSVLAWGLLRDAADRNELRPILQVGGYAVAGVLALLVAGVQLLPFAEFIGQSVRTLPLDVGFTASRSQDLPGLVHLFLPAALGEGTLGFSTQWMAHRDVPWLLSLYPGPVVLAFAGAGYAALPRREAWMWGTLGLVGLLLALGVHTPVYRVAFDGLAPIRSFRYPEKFAFLAALGLPFLVAAGYDRWIAGSGAKRLPAVVAGISAVYLVTAAVLSARPDLLAAFCGTSASRWCGEPAVAGRIYAGTALRVGLLAAAAAAAMLARRKLDARVLSWLLLVIVSVDLLLAHRAVNPSATRSVYTTTPWVAGVLDGRARLPNARLRSTPVDAAMGEVALVRGAQDLSNLYLDVQAMGPNQGQQWGFLQQDGLQGVELRSVAMTYDAAIHNWGDPLRFLRVSNVAYYSDPTDTADSIPGLREIAVHDSLPIRVFEVPDPLPRAYIAQGWESADGPAQALQRSLDPSVPLRRAILEGTVVNARPDAGSGRIVAATWEAERVRLIARAERPSVLVLLDRWYPGWHVTVGSERRPLLRANGAYRAVEIPAGESDVEFRFEPDSLRRGLMLSLAGLAGWALLLWRGRPGRRVAR